MEQKNIEINPAIVQGRKFCKLTDNRSLTWHRIWVNEEFYKIPLEIRQKMWEESRKSIKVKPFIKGSDNK